MLLDDLLTAATELGASDLLIKAGSPPCVRLDGELLPLAMPVLKADDAHDLCCAILTPVQLERLAAHLEVSASYEIPSLARFRVGVYRQRSTLRCAIRVIPIQPRSMDSLRLPPVSRYFAERPRGLVIVCGTAGSGRSTTIAAMINHVNQNCPVHIATLESPIEFVYPNGKALVDQFEIARDASSAVGAMENTARLDTNVIAVGELSDSRMALLCLDAAESGQLVFAAMQASSAVQAIDRIVDWFPAARQSAIRGQLADNLVGVISQRLIKRKEGAGRIAHFETLVGVPSVRSLIREGKNLQIHALIQSGQKQGMATHDQSLAILVKRGTVSYERAAEQAANLVEFDSYCGGGHTPRSS